jgi:hypothetical protein
MDIAIRMKSRESSREDDFRSTVSSHIGGKTKKWAGIGLPALHQEIGDRGCAGSFANRRNPW